MAYEPQFWEHDPNREAEQLEREIGKLHDQLTASEERVRVLEEAIEKADCETPELIYIGKNYTVAMLRHALREPAK